MKKIFYLILFASTFSFSQDWKTDFTEAKTLAKENDKKIILVFSGSDWCGPCIKMDKEIWKTNKFQEYSKSNYVMLKADFPRRKKNALTEEQLNHNKLLAEKYNRYGYFPFVVVLDKNANVIGETGYHKTTPEAFIKLINTY
ncbi:MAG: thioredoxin family protein [Winogradskyella sp.]|nr:MAG: thioredoxin family protein [Winogradskyella sp.]